MYAPPSPVKPVPTVYYKSDGTGRDKYITSNSGGAHGEYIGKRVQGHYLRSGSDTNLNKYSPKGKKSHILDIILVSYYSIV